MKKLIAILFFWMISVSVFACPVCERNKAKALQGITHGAGPASNWDYVIVFAIAIVAVLTLIYSIKWLVKPNEKNTDHIKLSILNG